jgi:hypothetical protein
MLAEVVRDDLASLEDSRMLDQVPLTLHMFLVSQLGALTTDPSLKDLTPSEQAVRVASGALTVIANWARGCNKTLACKDPPPAMQRQESLASESPLERVGSRLQVVESEPVPSPLSAPPPPSQKSVSMQPSMNFLRAVSDGASEVRAPSPPRSVSSSTVATPRSVNRGLIIAGRYFVDLTALPLIGKGPAGWVRSRHPRPIPSWEPEAIQRLDGSPVDSGMPGIAWHDAAADLSLWQGHGVVFAKDLATRTDVVLKVNPNVAQGLHEQAMHHLVGADLAPTVIDSGLVSLLPRQGGHWFSLPSVEFDNTRAEDFRSGVWVPAEAALLPGDPTELAWQGERSRHLLHRLFLDAPARKRSIALPVLVGSSSDAFELRHFHLGEHWQALASRATQAERKPRAPPLVGEQHFLLPERVRMLIPTRDSEEPRSRLEAVIAHFLVVPRCAIQRSTNLPISAATPGGIPPTHAKAACHATAQSLRRLHRGFQLPSPRIMPNPVPGFLRGFAHTRLCPSRVLCFATASTLTDDLAPPTRLCGLRHARPCPMPFLDALDLPPDSTAEEIRSKLHNQVWCIPPEAVHWLRSRLRGEITPPSFLAAVKPPPAPVSRPTASSYAADLWAIGMLCYAMWGGPHLPHSRVWRAIGGDVPDVLPVTDTESAVFGSRHQAEWIRCLEMLHLGSTRSHSPERFQACLTGERGGLFWHPSERPPPVSSPILQAAVSARLETVPVLDLVASATSGPVLRPTDSHSSNPGDASDACDREVDAILRRFRSLDLVPEGTKQHLAGLVLKHRSREVEDELIREAGMARRATRHPKERLKVMRNLRKSAGFEDRLRGFAEDVAIQLLLDAYNPPASQSSALEFAWQRSESRRSKDHKHRPEPARAEPSDRSTTDRHNEIMALMFSTAPQFAPDVLRQLFVLDPVARERECFVARIQRRTDDRSRWRRQVALVSLNVTNLNHTNQERDLRRAHGFHDDDLLLAPVKSLEDIRHSIQHHRAPLLLINAHGSEGFLSIDTEKATPESLHLTLKAESTIPDLADDLPKTSPVSYQAIVLASCNTVEFALGLSERFPDAAIIAFRGSVSNKLAQAITNVFLKLLRSSCVSWYIPASFALHSFRRTLEIVSDQVRLDTGHPLRLRDPQMLLNLWHAHASSIPPGKVSTELGESVRRHLAHGYADPVFIYNSTIVDHEWRDDVHSSSDLSLLDEFFRAI